MDWFLILIEMNLIFLFFNANDTGLINIYKQWFIDGKDVRISANYFDVFV